MNQHYTHLTQEERYQIYACKKAGFSNQIIADELARHISTIKCELKRNQGLRGYRPQQANRLAQLRQSSKPKAIKFNSSLEQIITQKLIFYWIALLHNIITFEHLMKGQTGGFYRRNKPRHVF